ncbi:MAG: hypothetical protein ACREH5_01665 [Candidatus Omnitrophota bacterium]
MKLHTLSNKLVLRVENKACEFLKGFTSNTLEAPRNVFLDVHGKIVAVFDQRVLNENEVLVVIERQFLGRLQKHLEKYLALGDTRLREEMIRVYFDLEGNARPKQGGVVIPQKAGCLILSKETLPADVSEEAFTLFRLKNNLPVQGVDYDEEMLLNVGNEEFVSYTKGCYLGQEIIARVHYRSKPPKKLIVKCEADCSPGETAAMTSRILDPVSGKVLGFVFTPL